MKLWRLVVTPIKYIIASFFALVFLIVACYLHFHRSATQKPRILWGPVPVGGTQYYSRACRALGYKSDTLMYGRYVISSERDFDYYPETIFPRLSRLRPFQALRRYLCFLWALPRYEIHFHNFDGGLLAGTPLEYLEIHLRHLARGRNVVYPYGGDTIIPRLCRSLLFKQALLADYPIHGRLGSVNERRIDHYTKHADLIYASIDSVDYLQRWDILLMQLSAIDVDSLAQITTATGDLRKRFPDKKIIFHAPNHRHIKGTQMLISACEDLKREGRSDFELVIYERQPNEVILQAIKDSDIIADSFVMGVYGLFSIEGMALGKPVLCYLRPDLVELYSHYSWAKECPIVNTAPNQIKDKLRWLLDHPEERSRSGQKGMEFVERHHSLTAMGAIYDQIIRRVWSGVEAEPKPINPASIVS